MIKVTDTWKGKSRGTPEEAMKTFTSWGSWPLPEVRKAIEEIYRIDRLIGLDASLHVSHAAVETGDPKRGLGFMSPAWAANKFVTSANRYNIAGMGITDDYDFGYRYKNGVEAGRAFVVHHAAYELEEDDPGWEVLKPYIKLDPRFNDVPKANRGTLKTVGQMNGKWWSNPTGAQALASRGNQIFPGTFDQDILVTTPERENPPVADSPTVVVFGKVPHFGFVDRQFMTANKAEGVGWNNLGKRGPLKGVVLHRMVGSLLGTDGFFPQAEALTDYGIGIAAQDGIGLSKVIYQWNDPYGYRTPWASGPLNGAYGDGAAFANKYGANAINKDLVSLEISGQYNTAIRDDEFQEIANFLAYWWDQMRIRWDEAPFNPATGISAVFFHQEFTLGTGKICPGPIVMNAINDLIARAKAIMKKYQTADATTGTGAPPAKPPVVTVPEPAWSPPIQVPELSRYTKADADTNPEGIPTTLGLALWVGDEVTSIRDTSRLQEPRKDAKSVGPTLPTGKTAYAMWLLIRPDGTRWYYTDYYTFFLAEDFKRTKD